MPTRFSLPRPPISPDTVLTCTNAPTHAHQDRLSAELRWRGRVETPTAARRRQLATQVRRVFDDSRQTSGCRRVAAQLNREGHECSVGLVADLMRELGLKAVQPRAYKRTTIPGEEPFSVPDLIGRDFHPGSASPGERLVGDITYLRTGEGWLYLATVIDLATRMVVGWQLATHMRTSLVVDALQMGIDAGLVEPDAIFHSDYAEVDVRPRKRGMACVGGVR